MSEADFTSRPPVTINWSRQYNCGPSDEHLHAIGQFIANYSMVEWQLAELFAHFLGMRYEDAQQIITEANVSMAGIQRVVKSKVLDVKAIDPKASEDLTHVIDRFEKLANIRHRIVHWQWGLTTGDTAYQSNLIRPRKNSKDEEITLIDLRKYCLDLIKILQAISLNMLVIKEQNTREEILQMRSGTSPEMLFRALP